MESYCNKNVSGGRNYRGMSEKNECNTMRRGSNPMMRDCASNMTNRNCERNVQVECVCQVNPMMKCHRDDKMEHLGCDFPPVMAYVPWQQWGDVYEADQGLKQGTMFKDLNYIFCGERW